MTLEVICISTTDNNINYKHELSIYLANNAYLTHFCFIFENLISTLILHVLKIIFVSYISIINNITNYMHGPLFLQIVMSPSFILY